MHALLPRVFAWSMSKQMVHVEADSDEAAAEALPAPLGVVSSVSVAFMSAGWAEGAVTGAAGVTAGIAAAEGVATERAKNELMRRGGGAVFRSRCRSRCRFFFSRAQLRFCSSSLSKEGASS